MCPLKIHVKVLTPTLHVCVCVCASCSVVSNSAPPGTVARQAPLSVEFYRQEYWRAMPFPSPDPWDRTQVSCIAGRFFTIEATREAPTLHNSTLFESSF